MVEGSDAVAAEITAPVPVFSESLIKPFSASLAKAAAVRVGAATSSVMLPDEEKAILPAVSTRRMQIEYVPSVVKSELLAAGIDPANTSAPAQLVPDGINLYVDDAKSALPEGAAPMALVFEARSDALINPSDAALIRVMVADGATMSRVTFEDTATYAMFPAGSSILTQAL